MLKAMISDLSTIYSQSLNLFPYWTDPLLSEWEKQYIDLLYAGISDPTTSLSIDAFYQYLMKFVSLLNDGHTRIYLPAAAKKQLTYLPFKLEIIEEQLVIVASLPEYNDCHFHPIKRINGIPVDEWFHLLTMHYWRSNTQHSLLWFQQEPAYFLSQDSLLLDFEDRPSKSCTWVHNQLQWADSSIDQPIQDGQQLFNSRHLLITRLQHTIIVRIKDFLSQQVVEDFYHHLPYLQASQEIIFDIRGNLGGNSGYANEIAQAFFDAPIQTEKVYYQQFDAETYANITQSLFHVQKEQWQDHDHWAYLHHQFYIEKNEADFYRNRQGLLKDKIVKLLIDPQTYSAAENFAMIFDQNKRGTIFGEASAGSTGQPALIKLHTGGTFMVTAKKVLHPNGQPHHNIGIIPHVFLKRKLMDKHRDRVLQDTLEWPVENYE